MATYFTLAELLKSNTAKKNGIDNTPTFSMAATYRGLIKFFAGKAWLEWGVLAFVYANEGLSIVGNYLESKGLVFSVAGVYKWLIRWVTGKAGVEADPDEILKEGEDGDKD